MYPQKGLLNELAAATDLCSLLRPSIVQTTGKTLCAYYKQHTRRRWRCHPMHHGQGNHVPLSVLPFKAVSPAPSSSSGSLNPPVPALRFLRSKLALPSSPCLPGDA
ncbi:hypothetical protein PCANC_24139 [Puccinia coronata f. sp. avenae]|uniref:Uncharacterized protein n=1 Tax=Puccinia coronata f. sp. avenae TaxID=200324 RepID=A0A2N5TQ92_9BASI|nr:hypothetical protein PCANC_24139 [Puccinia coronata f. sp. avenae]